MHLLPLLGGGLVLGYDCQSRCRHCLYGCGSHRRDGKPSPSELERVLDLLAELAPDACYHIGGGEPFLDRLRGPIDLGAFPVLRTLFQERGLEKLSSRARGLGFEPFETYSSACDLCTHVRVFLFGEEASPDLGPEGFCDPRSLPDFSSA